MKRTRQPRPEDAGPHTGLIYALTHWREWLLVATAEWMVRRWRGILFFWALVGFAVWKGWTMALVVLVLVIGWKVWRLVKGQRPKEPVWYDHASLSDALVAAGILRMVSGPEGQMRPTLSYKGQPIHTDHGTMVVVGLPQATTLDDVAAKRTKLAAALRIPTTRLEVHQEPEDAANVVRFHVNTPAAAEVPAEVASVDRTDWRDPIRVGADGRGIPVRVENDEQNSLFAGMPGSGKTALGRIRLAHYLLDPTTSVFILDGKGSVKDYGACRSMAAAYVSGVDENAVPDLIAMLAGILAEVKRRNAVDGDYRGWLVVLEEYQEPRAAADRDQRDTLDNILGRIIRMGRAVGVHVMILTQRPSVDDIPASARSIVTQRFCLKVRDASEARLVLGGQTAGVELPKGRGRAVFTDGGDLQLVTLDRLTDEAWRKVCARAAKLRSGGGAVGERPALSVVPSQPSAAPLLDEVAAILADAPPYGLKPTTIHERLSPTGREQCPSARDLGVYLASFPSRVTRARVGNDRVWRLTDASNLSARGV